MNISTLSKLEMLRTFAPMPWYLDQDNDSGIEVRDSTGAIVFFEDFGCIPDESPERVRVEVISRARALARFLVAFSEQPL